MKGLRAKGIVPAVLYGPKTKSLALEVSLEEFEKVFQEAGQSSLLNLEIEGKSFPVLIHDVKTDPLKGSATHVDFYQPDLKKEIVALVPLVFEGEPLAVKDLGGTLIKHVHEVEVKALPQNLPHEIKVNVDRLKTFEDVISVKDLAVLPGVKILKEAKDFVATVAAPEKVEEELEKPIEEKPEEVEQVEQKKSAEAEVGAGEEKERAEK